MATGYYDFGAETTGSAPTGFIYSSNVPTTVTALVQTDGGSPTGKSLQFTGTGSPRVIAVLDSLGNLEDVEVLAVWRKNSANQIQYLDGFQAISRVLYTNSANIAAYHASSGDQDTYTQGVGSAVNIVSGSIQQAGANVYPFNDITAVDRVRYKVRTVSGAEVEHKAWFWHDSQTDKLTTDAADVTWTDTTILRSAGRIGASFRANLGLGTVELLWLSWGTNGDPAPLTIGAPTPQPMMFPRRVLHFG
jgi:hypothetical protein